MKTVYILSIFICISLFSYSKNKSTSTHRSFIDISGLTGIDVTVEFCNNKTKQCIRYLDNPHEGKVYLGIDSLTGMAWITMIGTKVPLYSYSRFYQQPTSSTMIIEVKGGKFLVTPTPDYQYRLLKEIMTEFINPMIQRTLAWGRNSHLELAKR